MSEAAVLAVFELGWNQGRVDELGDTVAEMRRRWRHR